MNLKFRLFSCSLCFKRLSGRLARPETCSALHIDAALGGISCGPVVATSSADITMERCGKTINCIAHTHCEPPRARLHIDIQAASAADTDTDTNTGADKEIDGDRACLGDG